MAIEKLDTAGMDETALKFRDSIKQFGICCERMEIVTQVLLGTWQGKGRNGFEKQYRILKGKLADINDELYDIYEELIAAEAAFGEVDKEIAKELRS